MTSLSYFTTKQCHYKYKYGFCFIYRTLKKRLSRSASNCTCLRACMLRFRNSQEILRRSGGPPTPTHPPTQPRACLAPLSHQEYCLPSRHGAGVPGYNRRAADPAGSSANEPAHPPTVLAAMVVASKRNGTERVELTARHE